MVGIALVETRDFLPAADEFDVGPQLPFLLHLVFPVGKFLIP